MTEHIQATLLKIANNELNSPDVLGRLKNLNIPKIVCIPLREKYICFIEFSGKKICK